MDIFEAIEKRRAIKHFDPDYELREEEIHRLLSSAILSPTSFNIQNWRFVLVKDMNLRKKIREAAWDQAQITDASLLIVMCANKNAWQDSDRYWVNAPEDIRNYLVSAIEGFYKEQDQIQHDETMRSCGIAAQTLMLSAKALGYDSCPMVGFDFDKVGELIQLPDDHVISMIVVVGKALQEARPRGGQLPLDEVVIYDHF